MPSDFSLKGGWQPKGKDGKSKESWRGDFKGIDQIAGWMGKEKKDSKEDPHDHVSTPITQLKDPATFGAPPQRTGTAPISRPSASTAGSSGGRTNSATDEGGWKGQASNYGNKASSAFNKFRGKPDPEPAPAAPRRTTAQAQAEVEEEEPVRRDPPGPFVRDTTGLSTSNLPPPPVRRDTGSRSPAARIPAAAPRPPAAAPKPKPSLPPRLPPRQTEHPNEYTPAPPPPYSAASEEPPAHRGILNQNSVNRLGAAGVNVPGLGIGSRQPPPPPARTPSTVTTPPTPSRTPNSQLSELQSRFAKMGTKDKEETPAPAQGTTWAQKQAALKTASDFQQKPSSVSFADARNAASTANNFCERYGASVANGYVKANEMNSKYGISDKAKSFGQQASAQAASSYNSYNNNKQAKAEALNSQDSQQIPQMSTGIVMEDNSAGPIKKRPPPPPPNKKKAILGFSDSTSAPKSTSNMEWLTDKNFKSIVGKDKDVLVEFTTPWCGYCKTLEPEWKKVHAAFLSNEDVVVAKVNCDGEGTNTGRAEGVTAYPTIKFYPRHSTQGEEYPYARNEASITDFLRGKIAGAAPPPVPISSKPSLPPANTLPSATPAPTMQDFELDLDTLWFAGDHARFPPPSINALPGSRGINYSMGWSGSGGRKNCHLTGILIHSNPPLARTKIHVTWEDSNPRGTVKALQKHYPPPRQPGPAELQQWRDSYGEEVARWCEAQVGTQVGNGECWTLAHEALKAVAAQNIRDGYDPCMTSQGVVHGALIWEKIIPGNTGRPVGPSVPGLPRSVSDSVLGRGDILQFWTAKFRSKDGRRQGSAGMPDHTAVVVSVDRDGTVHVLEANTGGPKGRLVKPGKYVMDELVEGEGRAFRAAPMGWVGDIAPTWP